MIKTYNTNFRGEVGRIYDFNEIGCGGPEWYVIQQYPNTGTCTPSLYGTGPWDGVGDYVGAMYRGFAEFDLTGNPIPAGATITDITLKFTLNNTTNTRDCYIRGLFPQPSSYGVRGKILTAAVGTGWAGSGYSVGDILYPYMGASGEGSLLVTEVDGSGGVVAFTVITGGFRYREGYDITLARTYVSPAGGTGCRINILTTEAYAAETLYGVLVTSEFSELLYTADASMTTGAKSISLGASAITELETNVDYFALGFVLDESAFEEDHYFGVSDISLEVTYTPPAVTKKPQVMAIGRIANRRYNNSF